MNLRRLNTSPSASDFLGSARTLACVSIFCSAEAERDQERTPHFNPSRLYQTTQHWTDSILLRQRHMIEIQRARHRHPVTGRQHDLSRQSTNCSSRPRDDDLVKPVDDVIRVRTRTGRRLSGSRKVYQRISPRFNLYPPIPLRPKRADLRPRELVARRRHGPVNGRVGALPRGDQPQQTHALFERQRRDQRKDVISGYSLSDRLAF